MLETLERNNLFIVPLDDQRLWYRYHHLFAEVLRAHLFESYPKEVSILHQRASGWYEQNGYSSDAIRHALAAEDFNRAAGLIELVWATMELSYQSIKWLGWVKALPESIISNRPVLNVGIAWALLDMGELEASENYLQATEMCLKMPVDRIIVFDQGQFLSVPATIATARAYRSLALGDIPGTITYARQGLELTPEGDQTRYNEATSLLGLAQYMSGDLIAAERSLSEFQLHLQKTGDLLTLTGIVFLLADIRIALGRLHEAESLYQQTIRIATINNEPIPLGSPDLYRGYAELSLEMGDLETAEQLLQASRKLGELGATTNWLHRLYVSETRVKEALGDLVARLTIWMMRLEYLSKTHYPICVRWQL